MTFNTIEEWMRGKEYLVEFAKLDRKTQQIMQMKHLDYTFAEIAGEVGLSEDATKKRYYRNCEKINTVVSQ